MESLSNSNPGKETGKMAKKKEEKEKKKTYIWKIMSGKSFVLHIPQNIYTSRRSI